MCTEWFLFFSLTAKLNFSLSENCKNKFPARKTSLKQLHQLVPTKIQIIADLKT